MELSSSLLKEFAEETNDTEEITSRSTAYGTIVQSGARMYVQLDGSDQLTSIVQGTNVEAGDRVIVTIENHVATVTTNLSVPATGRITETMVEEGMTYGYFDLLEAQFATVGNLEAVYIYTEQISAELGSFEEIAADFITVNNLEAAFGTFGVLVADEIDAAVANLDEVYAGYIQAINADITNLYAATANIDDLTAKVAAIEEAYISYAQVQELLAGYASIEDLNAAYANITILDSRVANITHLLAGDEGVENLESIHLTSENAVIDEAVITEALIGTVLADIINSNIIYTDQITIMSEDGGIYIVGNQMQFSNGQIQFYDDNGVCRLQIGQDTSGNFTFVLYDETGTGIMIDSEGIHESAVPDGLIVDSMVAEDANIAASKIDMADVISYINDSGDLILDAYQIYIDGERLDYKLTEITESAVSEVINYYAIGPSPYEPPYEPGEETVYTDAICGIAICGLTYVGTIGWTTTRLYASSEGEYVWFVQKKIYVDGSYSWTEPTCLTDDYVRTKVSTMTTELEVVQGEISAKIWLTDIEDATNVLGDEITTITDQYAELDVTINEISAALGELTTSIGSDFEYFYSAIADITVQIDNISMGVSQNLEYIYGIYDEIEDLESQGIKSRTAYFAISYSPDYYPPYSFSPSVYTAITGLAICGLAVVGNMGYWTTEQPIPEEGQYVWLSYYVEKLDGSTYWETPILLSDEAAREQFTYISSQIAGIQILLDEIDIGIQNVYSYVDDEIEYVNERTAEIVLTLDEIDLGLKNLESIETEHYYYLYDQYTGISLELGSITARVEETASAVKSRKAYYALSYSSEYYPDLPGFTTIVDYNPSTGETTTIHEVDLSPSIYTAITGLAICGLAIVGNTGYWSDERPDASDGGYIWIAYLVTTIDGDQYWEDPVLLSDDVARSQYAVLSQRYAEIIVALDSIDLTVYSLSNGLDEAVEQITQISMELDSMTLSVYDSGNGMAFIQMTVGDNTSEVEVVTKATEAFENEMNTNNSQITIKAGTVTFESGTLIVDSENFSLDSDGNAVFSGTIYAAAGGTIGGFTIGSSSLYTNNNTLGSGSTNVYVGNDGISLGTTFKVTSGGVLTASSGTVGGWTLSSSAIYSGTSSMSSTTVGTYIGQSGFRQYSSSTAYTNIQNGNITCYSFSGNVITVSGSALSSIANLTITSSIYLGTSSSSSTTLYSYASCYFYSEVWCQTSFGGSRTRQPLGSNDTVGNRAWSISTYSSSVRVYGDCGTSGGSSTWTNHVSLSSSDSDSRLKNNIVETSIGSALNLLLSIKYYSFDWKADGSHEKIGFIAQQMEEVDSCLILPQVEDDEPLAINMLSLAAITAKSVQELYYITTDLEDRDDNLQLQIDDLKAENKALKEELAAIKAA